MGEIREQIGDQRDQRQENKLGDLGKKCQQYGLQYWSWEKQTNLRGTVYKKLN